MPDDPYILEELIACGPSAKVYRGHDLNTEKTVRLKVLMDIHVSCPVDHATFETLAPRLITLKHPNISTAVELNMQGGDVTLVTEFAAGANLWMFVRQHRVFTPADMSSLAEQLIMALEAGEARQMSHGNIKPSNIIIADSPSGGCIVNLQDWGEASCRNHQPSETLNYCAPELLSGGAATKTGDLFSVGAVLATLILEHAPVYGGSHAQLAAQWADFDTRMLRQRRQDLDAEFHEWLGWLLKPNPGQRPQSASAALARLRQAIKSVPSVSIALPPPTLSSHHDDIEPAGASTSTRQSSAPRRSRSGTWQRAWHVIMALGFSLSAIAAILGYMFWLMQRGDSTWPAQLRNTLIKKLDSWTFVKG